MNVPLRTLAPLLRKFDEYRPLPAEVRHAIQSWPFRLQEYAAGDLIAREGEEPKESAVLLDGFCFRQKLLVEGSRQILALHVPGDFIDLHSLVLKPLDHSILAARPTLVAKIGHSDLFQSLDAYPQLSHYFMWDMALDGAITRQWMTTMGQRSSYEQLAHLICELFFRLRRVRLVKGNAFDMVLTQAEIGDICGISMVHVNRSLRALERDGLIERGRRRIVLPDLDALVQTAGFDPAYLHLLAPD